MDRFLAMLLLLVLLSGLVLILLAIFAVAPVFCSCLISLLYTLYLFIAYEGSGVHHAQEFENRFWTIFALLFSTALFFANDSPVAIGRWSPSIGFLGVVIAGFGMHAYDRHAHRIKLCRDHALRRGTSAAVSLNRLKALGIPVEEQLATINSCLRDIDQLLIPSTINNLINIRFILQKEREIISILEEVHPRAFNYLIQHVKLGLLFYKVKDHRHLISGQHRTELIELLAVTRLSVLNVLSRVNVLHGLQVMNLQAHSRSEYWVKNIILKTGQDDLSELKSLTDAKGDYACMNQLIYNDIRTESIRHDILAHLKKEAKVQQAHMSIGTKKSKIRALKAWRKILSDVDDTLYCSGGHYPAGIDKRFANKVVYPGVLAFYRELDLGTQGPEEWPSHAVGNLVFLSARPHVYKDLSEAGNHVKFEKLKTQRSMHTTPSLLTGDLTSGRHFIVNNDMEPLAVKKFENFKRYVSIYPEFKHVFIGDNGQGDVRAAELMNDAFPTHLEAVYVHRVQELNKTFGYDLKRYWGDKGFRPYFFRTYPDAAIDAAKKQPPLIRVTGLKRVCQQSIEDFHMIMKKQWHSEKHRWDRRDELNQGLWRANQFLLSKGQAGVSLIDAVQLWKVDEKVLTPYGLAKIISFDPVFDMYKVSVDWSPLDVQVTEFKKSLLQQSTVLKDNNKNKTKATTDNHSEDNSNESIEVPSCIKPFFKRFSDIDEDVDTINSFPVEVKVLNDRVLHIDAEAPNTNSLHHVVTALPVVTAFEASGPVYADVSSFHSSPLRNCADNTVASDVTDDGFVLSSAANPASASTDSYVYSGILTNGKNMPAGALGLAHEVDMSEKNHFIVFATVHRSCISKYIPPALPSCYHTSSTSSSRSIFSFFGSEKKPTNLNPNNVGHNVQTPYGLASVREYRAARNIVVVDMSGWNAIAYLQKEHVHVINKGIFGNLFRKLSHPETDGSVSLTSTTKIKLIIQKDFPYVKGTKLKTPFGDGIVTLPLPHPVSRTSSSSVMRSPLKTLQVDSSSSNKILKDPYLENNQLPESQLLSESQYSTIGISLTSWVLSNKSHAILYCTTDIAHEWLNAKNEKSNIIASVLSKLSTALTIGRTPTTTNNATTDNNSKTSVLHVNDSIKLAEQHERYFKDGAAVGSPFGDGVVKSFHNDGIYEVLLSNWKAIAYLRKDSLKHQVAHGCTVGQCVLTTYGLTGILASIDPTTAIHIVTVHSLKIVMYLQPNAVICPIKAAVGETVLTMFGEGIIQNFRRIDSIYKIKLFYLHLYANEDAFNRMDYDEKDSSNSNNTHWLWRYLYFKSTNTTISNNNSNNEKKVNNSTNVRSRSNTITG